MRRRPLLIAALVVVALLAATAAVAAIRIERPVPPPRLSLTFPDRLLIAPGTAPALPLPRQGSLALHSSVDGDIASVAATQALPIGSVAKTMTALVTLEAKPIPAGTDGPSYTITDHDVALYRQMVAAGGSVAPVSAGEVFSERGLLLALMLPSANNLAETLALWVDGDRAAFIAHLNARAAALGMTSTHFADPAGFNDATVSSAADLVKLGEAALGNPTLASIVATRSTTLPDGTVVQNLDRNLAQPGWLGIKTGSTNAAGGCLLFAAERVPPGGGPAVRVVGAMLGQPTLDSVLTASLAVTDAALGRYAGVDLGKLGLQVGGSVSTDWGASSGVTVVPRQAGVVVVPLGTEMSLSAEDAPLVAPLAAGTAVAVIHATLPGGANAAVYEVRTTTDVAEPDLGWRLRH